MTTIAGIAALPRGQRPTIQTLRHLWSLKLDLFKRQSDGPWDRWDGELVDRWNQEVDDQIRACTVALEVELDQAHHYAEILQLLDAEVRWLRTRASGATADRAEVLLVRALQLAEALDRTTRSIELV